MYMLKDETSIDLLT